jgi:uncharacterized protein
LQVGRQSRVPLGQLLIAQLAEPDAFAHSEIVCGSDVRTDIVVPWRHLCWLTGMRRLIVAFSAGVDSTLLLKIAVETLGPENVLACTGVSPSLASAELVSVKDLAKQIGAPLRLIETKEMDNPLYVENSPRRCYNCKKELYTKLQTMAESRGFRFVLDGTNLDDLKDHRPGLQAAEQWRIRHPLVEAGMTKDDIRRYSRELNLPTWDKPSSPCLSSRFPYGTAIDVDKLKKVGACEVFLKELGFREFRVRYHGDLARIEVNPNEIDRLFDKPIRDLIVKRFKEVGFSFVSLDLQGFRSGSLNEGLKAPAH